MIKILIDEAVVRQALEDFVVIKYGLEKSRIWGGVDWTYNPIHPVHYLPLRDKAEARMESLNQAIAEAEQAPALPPERPLDPLENRGDLFSIGWNAYRAAMLNTPPAPAGYVKKIESLIAERDALKAKLAEQPAQQEPVALRDTVQKATALLHTVVLGLESAIKNTSPPAQRTWVGLTDEQKDAARYQHIKGMARAMSLDINGNHYWTVALHGVRGPSLDEAIDRAIEAAHGITKGGA